MDMAYRFCNKCGSPIQESDVFCAKCGNRLPHMPLSRETEIKDSDNDRTTEQRKQDPEITDLAEQFIQGDSAAYEQLYQKEASKVYARARLMLQDEYRAEDITQDVFLTVYTKISQLNKAGAFEGWLMTLTRNACINLMKKENRLTSFAVDEEGESVEEELENPYMDFQPERSMEQRELELNLKEIFALIPESQSICLQMKEYDGLSYQQIAEALQISLSQVKNNIFHARKKVEREVRNRKLYMAAPLPFFYWMLHSYVDTYAMPAQSLQEGWLAIASKLPDAAGASEGNAAISKENPSAGVHTEGSSAGSEAQIPKQMPQQTPSQTPQQMAGITGTVKFSAAKILVAGILGSAAIVAVLYFAVPSVRNSVNKIMPWSKTEADNKGSAADSTIADADKGADEDQRDPSDSGEDQETAAEKDSSEEADEKTDQEEAFEPVDYGSKLSADEKEKLYAVIEAVFDIRSSNNDPFWNDEQWAYVPRDENMDTGMDEPVAQSEIGLERLVLRTMQSDYDMSFKEYYTIDESYGVILTKEEMDGFCQHVFNRTFETPEWDFEPEAQNSESFATKYYSHGYIDGKYYIYTGDYDMDPIRPVVDKYVQTGKEDLMLYGRILEDNDAELGVEMMHPETIHSFAAKCRIDPESPTGCTVLGLVFDSEESNRETGFDSASVAKKEDFKEYILPESSEKLLKESDLKELSDEELRIARNEIYARHGRKFQAEDLQKYFGEMDWYEGKIEPDDFKDEMLSDIERENANLIKEVEEDRQKRN